MSQRLVTSFINTVTPGAYPNVRVISQPASLGASGILVIIGEADSGDYYGVQNIKNNFYSPDQLNLVSQTYGSGPIVDAFRALSSPSADTDINGSANKIYVVKTNNSAKAQSVVDTDYGTFSAINSGLSGNKYKYQITSIASENTPEVSGTTIPTFGAALNAMTFSIRLNGGAATAVTLSGTPSNHSNIATLIVELAALLPSGITVSAGTALNSLKFKIDADASANRKGWGKSFELIDTVPGDLLALGLAASFQTSSVEPGVEVAIARTDIGLSETFDVNEVIALNVNYLGTTCTLTINSAKTLLTTTAVGGLGSSLSIDLTQYRTLSDLKDFINSQAGYTASIPASSTQLAPTALDSVTAIGIACSNAANQAGRIKDADYAFQKAVGASKALSFAPTATAGLPNVMVSSVFLSGGAKGFTTSLDIVNVIDQLSGISVNIIVPLFSQDASADITDGTTDSNSTYTIAAINASIKSHCIQYSTPKLKKNRIAILSYWNDSFNDAKAVAQGMAHYRCSVAMQKATQVDSTGNIKTFLPWYSACVAAGMQAGGFYKSICNKFANVIGFVDPAGFDSGSPGSVEDALQAGLLFLTQEVAGNRWVSDQTTYGLDTNFVYNSIQAVYCSDLLSLDLADSFQKTFVGQSLADVDAAVAKAFLGQKMDGYRKVKLIAGSDDAPAGYKNVKIKISGPEMDVSVEIKLATAIYFIPIDLSISQVQSNA